MTWPCLWGPATSSRNMPCLYESKAILRESTPTSALVCTPRETSEHVPLPFSNNGLWRCPWTQTQKCPLDPPTSGNFSHHKSPHLPGWHHWVTAHPAGASLLLWSEGGLGPLYYRDNPGDPTLPASCPVTKQKAVSTTLQKHRPTVPHSGKFLVIKSPVTLWFPTFPPHNPPPKETGSPS